MQTSPRIAGRLFSAVSLLGIGHLALADHAFYAGSIDGRASLRSYGRSFGSGSMVFEDANLHFYSFLYGGVFGHFRLSNDFVIQGAEVEFRTGVSAGNPGELVFSRQDTNVLRQPTSTPGVDKISVNGWEYNPLLPTGRYYIGFRLIGAFGTAELLTTSGIGGEGSPLGNGNSFFNEPLTANNFSSTQSLLGQDTWDFSIGMVDLFVPEPISATGLATGFGLLLLRKRKACDR